MLFLFIFSIVKTPKPLGLPPAAPSVLPAPLVQIPRPLVPVAKALPPVPISAR